MSRTIQGVNVAVCGGAGFLGSHLVDHLIDDRQCNVLVIDNLASGRREFVHPKATFEHHDITGSENHLLKIFQQYKIDYCFNYAAHPYIPVSFARPLYVFDTNAMGALKVINAAQEAGCKGILQVSSAEIYGEGNRAGDFQINEHAQAIPHSTYGAAKLAIDSLVQCRWKEAKTPCIALRQFNCVGPRETHPYVVPEIISQLHHDNNVWKDEPDHPRRTVELGNNSSRDFQYAGDAVAMAVELLEKGEFGSVYNMGSESSIKIYDLAKLIGKLMGFEAVEVITSQERIRPWEIWSLTSDNTKLYSVIDYRPKVNLEEALKKTIEYFYLHGKKWCWEN